MDIGKSLTDKIRKDNGSFNLEEEHIKFVIFNSFMFQDYKSFKEFFSALICFNLKRDKFKGEGQFSSFAEAYMYTRNYIDSLSEEVEEESKNYEKIKKFCRKSINYFDFYEKGNLN